AVQRGARAADDLDLLRRAEIEAVDRALAVRQGLRDAVDEDLHAAYAEIRAGPEAADRHAQVLREIEPVLHEETRHARQRLVEPELLTGELDVVFRHDADGRGDLIEGRLETRRPDDDLLERRQRGSGQSDPVALLGLGGQRQRRAYRGRQCVTRRDLAHELSSPLHYAD